jgi:hypothetical protein
LALLASTARAEEASICTDRPTKGNAVCTVPPRQWQVESAAVDWLRLEQGGSESETLLIGSSVLKFGLTDRSDLQLGFTPYVHIYHRLGVGDLTVRYKLRLTGASSAAQVAVIPSVKLPTAGRGIGNRKVEGGVTLPVSFALAGPVTMTFGPELDLVADSDRHGRHAAIIQLVNVAAPVAPRLTLIGELWANWNFDPDGTVKQASADVAGAYAASPRVQLDAGANFGITSDTPDVEVYAGVSIRF